MVIEKEDGELVEVKPVRSTKSARKTVAQEDDEAFLSAAGGWANVDTDAFLKDIYESRKSSRPPVASDFQAALAGILKLVHLGVHTTAD